MSREVWVWDEVKQKVVLREDRTPRQSKSAHVISDSMPMLKHMGTGKYSDSKSAHRSMTRSMGFVEAGSDPAASRAGQHKDPPMIDYVNDVKRAIAEQNR